ncbi:hypothetical protein [Clostridium ganghwense]|uniref:SbsA Ig-like domain-containing protein n=1 Tax=Clostridium ganghwense TaxID=312089 RepID=A0ABT4CQW0_9CLOT|nr:hypothetical protein [Clostridium ganghwense]MCY6370616.1 hypothetical protein [Clostridium ganghwense]
MKKIVVGLMFILFAFCFGVLEVYADEPDVGGKNNFQTATPIVKNNADVTSDKITSHDGNNPFSVVYEFDLSKYKQSINDGKFEMDFRADSDSWYQNEKKGTLGIGSKKWAYERPVLSVYTMDYNNNKSYLIYRDDSGESNTGEVYKWKDSLPANTKIVKFEFDSKAAGDYRGTGFGADYHNMFLSFKDKADKEYTYASKPVLGEKNNFESAKPTYEENANIRLGNITSRDGNNPFKVIYVFDLSKYEKSINEGKFEMDFRAGSDSWCKNEKKFLGRVTQKWGYERPMLSVYTMDYVYDNDRDDITTYLINHDSPEGSNDGKDYAWKGTLPAGTKIIKFEFDSAAAGDYKSTGFGAYYHNVFLSFKDKANEEDTYINKPVLGEKNNFESANPTYEKNANVTSDRISSKDGNNPFEVTYVFDLSEYKQLINKGKFEMKFKSDSDSWYQHHVKDYIWNDGKRVGYERPILTIYTTDYNNHKNYLIKRDHSGESNNGKKYNLDAKVPANTKTITFELNSEYGGAHGATEFGACYMNMQLFFIYNGDLTSKDKVTNWRKFKEKKSIKDKSKRWKINFNKSIEGVSVNNDNVFISTDPSGGNRLDGIDIKLSDSGKSILINYDCKPIWETGKTYYLFVQNVKTAEGEIYKSPLRMEFTVK